MNNWPSIMKRTALVFTVLTSLLAFISCDKIFGNEKEDEEKGLDIELTREQLIGKWQVDQAKFAIDAKMTEWDYSTTTIEFMENGIFNSRGYFGNNEGVFTVSGNTVKTTIENKPFLSFLVTAIDDDKNVSITTTVESTGAKIWMICHSTKDATPGDGPSVVSYETMFRQEQYVSQFLAKTYSHLGDFIYKQLEIEGRVCSGDFSDLTTTSSSIEDLWRRAYKVIDDCAVALTYIPLSTPQNAAFYMGQFTALRGIIAYELATLWGDAWFYIAPIGLDEKPGIVNANTLLESARTDLKYAADNFGNVPEGYINKAVALTFYAIAELSRGFADSAKACLHDVSQAAGDQGVSFSVYYTEQWTGNQKPIEVFNAKTYQLLYDEAYGNLDNLNQSWKDSGLSFGYWQMLTRTKLATAVTGCQQHQMLFPIPIMVLNADSNMKQNPGY